MLSFLCVEARLDELIGYSVEEGGRTSPESAAGLRTGVLKFGIPNAIFLGDDGLFKAVYDGYSIVFEDAYRFYGILV